MLPGMNLVQQCLSLFLAKLHGFALGTSYFVLAVLLINLETNTHRVKGEKSRDKIQIDLLSEGNATTYFGK